MRYLTARSHVAQEANVDGERALIVLHELSQRQQRLQHLVKQKKHVSCSRSSLLRY